MYSARIASHNVPGGAPILNNFLSLRMATRSALRFWIAVLRVSGKDTRIMHPAKRGPRIHEQGRKCVEREVSEGETVQARRSVTLPSSLFTSLSSRSSLDEATGAVQSTRACSLLFRVIASGNSSLIRTPLRRSIQEPAACNRDCGDLNNLGIAGKAMPPLTLCSAEYEESV